ncbi:MAG: Ig-like domain-containing protein [Bacteroidales bacterium]|nr:Ig-like domain-containing protein [Bacteroidales bacterium]
MKRFLVFTINVVLSIGLSMADDYTYPYLVFTDSDGDETTVSVDDLEITFSDGQLVATNGDGSITLTLSTLASMAFSTTGGSSSEKTACGLAFSSATATAQMGEDFTEPTLTNPYNLTVTWTSSDESVATVDDEGEVTLAGVGITTITATFAGNSTYKSGSAAYTLTVEKAATVDCELSFESETVTATLGEDFTEPTLVNPYELFVTWTSSDESVATVNDEGEVTLVSAGTTTITAAFAGDDNYNSGSAAYTLTVEKAATVDCELSFESETATATMGEDFTEPTLVNPYELSVTWTSSDESVATVNDEGEVTLVSAGTTTITAAFAGDDNYNSGSAAYTLTVAKAEPVDCELSFESETATATMGEDFTEPTLTNPYEVVVAWTSSDESVATVDDEGEVTLVSAGTTTITAAFAGDEDYNSASASYELTVEAADAINNLSTSTAVKVYTVSGMFVGNYTSMSEARAALKPGLYVINANNKNFKLNIR